MVEFRYRARTLKSYIPPVIRPPRPGPLRGVVVGLGSMGLNHLRVLEEMRGVRVAGVVEPDARRRAAAATRDRVERFVEFQQALDKAAPDFVCVATPVDQLHTIVHEAIDAGIAVLAEKPLAPDERAALELAQLAESRGVLLAVGHVERFNPAVRVAKAQLESGRLGRVYQMRARRLGQPRGGSASTVGVAIDLATHDLDVMRYLVGSEVTHVAGKTVQQDSVAADALFGIVRFDIGIIALVEVSRVARETVRELVVTGDEGTLVLDYLAQDVTLHARGAPTRRLHIRRREPLRIQWQVFLAALRRGTAGEVTGFDAVAALSSARALQLAAARGSTVIPSYRALDGVLGPRFEPVQPAEQAQAVWG